MNHLIEKILSLDTQLVHIMGPENQIADYVSRHLTSEDKDVAYSTASLVQ